MLQCSMIHATNSHMSILHRSISLTACSIQSIQFLFHVVIFSWDMTEEALIGFIVLEVLEDDEQRPIIRGNTRKLMQRRQEQGRYNNLVKELRLEDTKGYNEMMRMKYSSFQFLLANIERDITPMKLAKGGFKPICPAGSLTLTLRFMATGESFRPLSFQFRISKSANFYMCKKFPGQLSQIWPAHT